MKSVSCNNCQSELCFAQDTSEDKVVKLKIVCPCGYETTEMFLGYPRLAGNDKYYFEFVDEFKIACKLRK
jgi:hypothetical protein